MPNRGKHHKHRHQGEGRWNRVVLGGVIFLLLALVATLFWLISSPQFVKPQ